MQCFLSTFILRIAQFNSGVTKCDQHSPYGTTGEKKTQELDTSLIASIPKSLLRTLRTFAQQEATRGLVLCQMTALLVLDPAPAAKLEGKSGGQAGQQWVLTQSLPQSFLVYSISNAIQYIEFVYMYHIYIHNTYYPILSHTIPYYPILSHYITIFWPITENPPGGRICSLCHFHHERCAGLPRPRGATSYGATGNPKQKCPTPSSSNLWFFIHIHIHIYIYISIYIY